MIGETINFVRFGNIPQSGFSHNYATGDSEKGISCYAEGQTFRAEFEERETVIRGTAKVVGTGSDGEPVIDPRTIKLTSCSKHHQNDVDCAAYCYQHHFDTSCFYD